HYLGVNWVWTVGIVPVHVVLSIGLPILLLGLALPETRGRPLLNRREVVIAVGVFGVDVLLLAGISHYYPIGLAEQLSAVVVVAALAVLAYGLPRDLLNPTSEHPRYRPAVALLLGLAFYPGLLFIPALGERSSLGAPLVVALEFAFAAGLFLAVRRPVGRRRNEAQLVMVALGALIPIVLFGFFSQLFLPLVAVFDVLFGLLFYTLWRRYRPAWAGPLPPFPAGAR
ncbi:MAG: hypothetical protein ACREEC_14065, partial [Thermoplasmata archaeon]